jgi:hypothetical protein
MPASGCAKLMCIGVTCVGVIEFSRVLVVGCSVRADYESVSLHLEVAERHG